MKKSLLIVVALIVAACSSAQKKVEAIGTLNAEFMLPAGKVANPLYTAGFGGSIQLELKSKKDSLSFVTSTGYYILDGVKGTPGVPTLLMFPTMFGAKYRFSKTVSFQQMGGFVLLDGGNGTKFIYAPILTFDYQRVSSFLKFTSIVFSGHQNDISTFGIGFSYKL